MAQRAPKNILPRDIKSGDIIIYRDVSGRDQFGFVYQTMQTPEDRTVTAFKVLPIKEISGRNREGQDSRGQTFIPQADKEALGLNTENTYRTRHGDNDIMRVINSDIALGGVSGRVRRAGESEGTHFGNKVVGKANIVIMGDGMPGGRSRGLRGSLDSLADQAVFAPTERAPRGGTAAAGDKKPAAKPYMPRARAKKGSQKSMDITLVDAHRIGLISENAL